ncbi:hypothetical protein [Ureaplasma canigenitalium]|uniref:hypothetical protein n=1 Tax=Ureaplasma canigenitalium TaxID=42092 RepID=UPI0004E0CAC2|nr:hypothetical protein [Ureaplasma canigenitalium]
MKKVDFLIYYKAHKKGLEIDDIVEEFKVNKEFLLYKFQLIDYHGKKWSGNLKLSWKWDHIKFRLIKEYEKTGFEYKKLFIVNGIYNITPLVNDLGNF